MRIISILPAALAALSLTACGRAFENVPPNDIGMVLTPTGYENKIYTPGQVDIGTVGAAGQENRLVLIQRSGFSVEEQFREPGASTEKSEMDASDHRCLTKDTNPMTLDVRLIFALPDYNTLQGQKDLARIFLLGNPIGNDRILHIGAESIYEEQAKIQVRPAIRQICAEYTDFNAALADFGNTGPDSFGGKIEAAVANILKQQDVPLRLVSAMPSNMKPDARVVEAGIAQVSAQRRNQAIQTVTDFLNADPTGTRKYVYQMQTLQEIMNANNLKGGTNTLYLTDIGVGNRILALPR